MASASSQSARRGSCQSSRDAASQPSKVGRRKWTIFEVGKLVEAMREMVDIWSLQGDNGFKPGILTLPRGKDEGKLPKFRIQGKTSYRMLEDAEATSKGRKRLSSDSRTTIGEYMLQAAEVMAVEIGKSTIEIAKAILDDKDRREGRGGKALEEVYGLPPIERAIYATKW
ncbi:hypothetical protein Sjap_016945 [Stephania japonica]|uniref:Uncharacterized protein n=1 Tax=Stephania japonica TaxID=461633 RepID=A0AAP0I5C5_9MAGN